MLNRFRAGPLLSGVVLCGAIGLGPAFAGDLMPDPAITPDGGFITFQTENDLFAKFANTDRHYTNGMKASWLSGPTNDLPDWLKAISAPPLFGLFTDEKNITGVSHRVGVALSQAIFTPDDTDTTAPITNDRPYAAWLHTTFTLESIRSNDLGDAWQDQWKLDLGVIGPAALGRQVQNGWHKIINVEQASGWANQLRNEPGVNLSFERAWRSSVFETPKMFGLATDVIPYGTVAVGNVLTYAGGGAVWRIGPTLPDDFGPPRIYPGTGGSEWFHASTGFDWYLFAGLEGRAVARDIFLDGNTFRDSLSVDKRPLVGDLKLGAVAVLGSTRLSFTHDFRTREFYGQPKIDQFGSLVLGFAL
ncbi:MAG: lipid A deacylase LpxR family protein [Parvibaculum sp.]|uniref:lipid A deacylase LpxR family protein n=1 Tax=Parvibaculum sp. TaxID=2024848 RepID=UPI003C740FCD